MEALAGAEPAVEALFATETMAELCARQGRVAEALAIFRRLLEKGPGDGRAQRWSERLAELTAAMTGSGPLAASAPASVPAPALGPRTVVSMPVEPQASLSRMAVVIQETVRSGQLVYAQATDLIVLAQVNAGAELMADGNIHVYGALRGRAVAGAMGAKAARIFCQRLEAELVGVDAAYVTAEALPPERFGKPAQVRLDSDRCVIAAL
jgi:septum site-determining protein MinC